MRDMYLLPDVLEVGQNGGFATNDAQISIFQGSQLWKNISSRGLFP